jgi:uncharacterized protein YjcR
MADNESKRRRGAQPGNKNAIKHGYYSKDSKDKLYCLEKLIIECYSVIKESYNLTDKQCIGGL